MVESKSGGDESCRSKPAESKPAENKPVPIANRPTTSQCETKPAEQPKAADEDPYEVWLKEYYAGKRRPKWAADLIAPLEKMLQAKNVDERLAAAIALVPLGKAQAVLPQLYEVAQSDPKKYREVMEVLPWLVWEQRLAAFRQLRKIAPTPDAVSCLVHAMAEVRDPRAAELLWELLADAKTTEQPGRRHRDGPAERARDRPLVLLAVQTSSRRP